MQAGVVQERENAWGREGRGCNELHSPFKKVSKSIPAAG